MRRSIEQVQIEEYMKKEWLDMKKKMSILFFIRFKKYLRVYKTENSFFIWLSLSVFFVSIYCVKFFPYQNLGYRIAFAYGLASLGYVITRTIQVHIVEWVDNRESI